MPAQVPGVVPEASLEKGKGQFGGRYRRHASGQCRGELLFPNKQRACQLRRGVTGMSEEVTLRLGEDFTL